MPVLERLRKIVKTQKTIAVFVDGPNMIRKELGIDLSKVKKRLEKIGKVKVARVCLDQYASDKLVEAVTNQGFDVVIVPSDVDVALAVDASEFIFDEGRVDVVALVTRDSDYKPLLAKAKAHGKDTVVVGCEPDFSSALKNTADLVIDAREVSLEKTEKPDRERGERSEKSDKSEKGDRSEKVEKADKPKAAFSPGKSAPAVNP